MVVFFRKCANSRKCFFLGVWSHCASCVSPRQLWRHDHLGLGTRVGAKKPPLSILRILHYPNPPGAPTFYPERSENDLILGLLVSPGYFFITLVLLVGLALGDANEYGVGLSRLCYLTFFFLRCVSSTPLAFFST